jgi:hypothetical protein
MFFEDASLFRCYRDCKLLQAIWKSEISHYSGSFRRIGGFLETEMSVIIYVTTQTTTALDFQWKRKERVRGKSGREGDKWGREGKGS